MHSVSKHTRLSDLNCENLNEARSVLSATIMYSPMTLVSANIFVPIFEGFSVGHRSSNDSGVIEFKNKKAVLSQR